jgi:hypothetical protein
MSNLPSLSPVLSVTALGKVTRDTKIWRCSMPILIMGLAALAVFLVIGGMLFMAGISERRQSPEKLANLGSPRKTS